MKLFLAIFAATLVLGPLLAVVFYLGALALSDLSNLVAWLSRRAAGRPELFTPRLVREHGMTLLGMSYFLGGLPAAAGGAFLGWRFTRTPPKLGLGAPLLLGLALGLLVTMAMTGFRPTATSLALGGLTVPLALVSAASCSAIARLIYGAMGPRSEAPTAARGTGR